MWYVPGSGPNRVVPRRFIDVFLDGDPLDAHPSRAHDGSRVAHVLTVDCIAVTSRFAAMARRDAFRRKIRAVIVDVSVPGPGIVELPDQNVGWFELCQLVKDDRV